MKSFDESSPLIHLRLSILPIPLMLRPAKQQNILETNRFFVFKRLASFHLLHQPHYHTSNQQTTKVLSFAEFCFNPRNYSIIHCVQFLSNPIATAMAAHGTMVRPRLLSMVVGAGHHAAPHGILTTLSVRIHCHRTLNNTCLCNH